MKEEKVMEILLDMQGDIKGLKEDVSGLKEDVSGIHQEMADMKSELRQEMADMKSELRQEMNKRFDEQDEKIIGLHKLVEEMHSSLFIVGRDEIHKNTQRIERIENYLKLDNKEQKQKAMS